MAVNLKLKQTCFLGEICNKSPYYNRKIAKFFEFSKDLFFRKKKTIRNELFLRKKSELHWKSFLP